MIKDKVRLVYCAVGPLCHLHLVFEVQTGDTQELRLVYMQGSAQGGHT